MINPSLAKLYDIMQDCKDRKTVIALHDWIDTCLVEAGHQMTVTKEFFAHVEDKAEVESYLGYMKKKCAYAIGEEVFKLAKEEVYDTRHDRRYQYRVLVLK